MTPAQMFEMYGNPERCRFSKGDNVVTPIGLDVVEYEFTRGLKWYVKTKNGTFLSETINGLNDRNTCLKK